MATARGNAAKKAAAAKADPKESTEVQEQERLDAPETDTEAQAVAEVASPELDQFTDEEIRELRRKAYTLGQKRLREENKAAFQEFVKEEAAKLGVTYEFQKTADEKAEEQMAALLEAHPHLREKLVSDLPPAERPLSYGSDDPA